MPNNPPSNSNQYPVLKGVPLGQIRNSPIAAISPRVKGGGTQWYNFKASGITLSGTNSSMVTLTDVSGTNGIAYDSSGSRTGNNSMMKMVCNNATGSASGNIFLTSAASLNVSVVDGRMGFWIYLSPDSESLFDAFNFDCSSYNGFNFTSDYDFSVNANQIRPGWNFLVLYASPTRTTHPFGISQNNGSASADFTVSNLQQFRFYLAIPANTSFTMYFDSAFCGWNTTPAVAIGWDGTGLNGTTDVATPWVNSLAAYGWRGYCMLSAQVPTTSNFNGYISGTTLTTSSGAPAIGMTLSGPGITVGTSITAGSGTSWTVSISQTVGSSGSQVAITGQWANTRYANFSYGSYPQRDATIQNMYNAGWDICNHTLNHTNTSNSSLAATLTNDQLTYQIKTQAAFQIAHGWERGKEIYGAPQGQWDWATNSAMAGMGIIMNRAGDQGLGGSATRTIYGYAQLMNMPWLSMDGPPTGVASANACIATIGMLIAYGGDIILGGHQIIPDSGTVTGSSTTGSNLTLYQTTLNLILAYLQTQVAAGNIAISTLSEMAYSLV